MKIDYEGYVENLGFELVKSLRLGDCCVYKASIGDLLVTVKFGATKKYSLRSWGYNHVNVENRVLDRVKEVDGIAEKISFHKLGRNPRLVALVKNYIEDGNCKLTDQDVLINAVNALHENGIARLDLYGSNIIIDPSGKPYLIDLGLCIFKEELSKRDFALEKRNDLRCLESMLNFL